MYHIYSPDSPLTVTYSGVHTPIGEVPCTRHIADWVAVAVHIVVDWAAAAAVAGMGFGRGSSFQLDVGGVAVGRRGSARAFHGRLSCFLPSDFLSSPYNYG